MSTINVEDSTDWLSTTVPGLSRLETSLRCQVCRDFLTSPMITSCAHTFCSLCIRKSLSAEGKCPACREPESVSKLRRNWAVEESVAAWRAVREKVLAVARQEGKSEKGKKRDATEAEMEAELPRRTQRRKVVAIDSDDEEYRPEEERNDGLVPCPICSKRMKEADVFGHLDKCQAERQQRPPPKTAFNPPPSSQSTPTKRPQNLAHANFGLMKSEVHVRNQLKNAGIPAWGSRDVMMRRHVEWVNMFNANNDAEHPKPRGQLLRELDEWDKFQGGWAARVKKPKETDGQEYIRQHKEHYEELKAAALASMRKAVAKPVEEPKEGEPGQQQQNAPNQQQQNEPKPEASGPTGALPESTPAAGPVGALPELTGAATPVQREQTDTPLHDLHGRRLNGRGPSQATGTPNYDFTGTHQNGGGHFQPTYTSYHDLTGISQNEGGPAQPTGTLSLNLTAMSQNGGSPSQAEHISNPQSADQIADPPLSARTLGDAIAMFHAFKPDPTDGV